MRKLDNFWQLLLFANKGGRREQEDGMGRGGGERKGRLRRKEGEPEDKVRERKKQQRIFQEGIF